MKNIKNKLKLYLPFAKAGIKIEITYKAQIFMWIAISFIQIFFVLFLYKAIYRNSPEGLSAVINGFTFYDMVLYMLTSFFFSFIMGAGETSYDIWTDIREGTVANSLTKPVSYRLRHLFAYLGVIAFDFVLIIVPFMTVIYAIFISLGLLQTTFWAFLINVVFFLIFSILAAFINNALSYFVGMLVFYTDHLFGLNMARNALQGFLGGQMVPLAYMGTLGVIFSYTPFAFMNSVPVLTLMGKLDYKNIIIYIFIALLWVVLIEFINHIIFKHALKKITVQGG